ncbi:MAG: cation:dicarboxylase symporter family transporter [Oscillospiraceae bacterium]|jgi:L-cystine uptake protein TcyP (sodium:dicarboxylate symporter family)|nr:cation:dicarboxylase symporter family transporter [Oscillospiraceae bacterium]
MAENGMLNSASIGIAAALVAAFLALAGGLVGLRRLRYGKPGEDGKPSKKVSFGVVMLTALAFGALFGVTLKGVWGLGVSAAFGVNAALEWVDILEVVFLKALELIIVPLVLVSIIRSFLKVGMNREAGKSGGRVLLVLLGTVAASGAIGYALVRLFRLDPSALKLTSAAANTPTSIIETIEGIVPNNLFRALSSNSALPVVFLGILIAAAAIAVKRYNEDFAAKFATGIEIAYEIIGTIVDFVIKFTPFGILSMVSVQVATNDWSVFATLGGFIGAFYAGIAAIAATHIVLLAINGVSLKEYFSKTANTYLFAFTSMSSMATLPLTIKSQQALGVDDETANLAGTLGTCVGQNACAGLYPAMLATIVALGVGQNPWTWAFGVQLVLFTMVSSVGVAGVGGGNVQASLLLLAMMGLPYQLITLFLSIDFVVGLGRPPINCGDSLIAGVIAQKMAERSRRKAAAKTTALAAKAL